MRKRRINPNWRIIIVIPIVLIGYLIYDAIYPSSEFYELDFNEVTGIELPNSTDFEFKTASFPDIHGDYTSVSLINVDSTFYANLPSNLIENGLSQNENRIGHPELDLALSKLHKRKIEMEFSKEDRNKFYYVAFLSDKKTILVQRSSH